MKNLAMTMLIGIGLILASIAALLVTLPLLPFAGLAWESSPDRQRIRSPPPPTVHNPVRSLAQTQPRRRDP